MRTKQSALLFASLALFAGCAQGTPSEPSPSTKTAVAPPASPGSFSPVGVVAGDITPSTLHVRDAIAIDDRLVNYSAPANPAERIADEGVTEYLTSTDATKIAAGSPSDQTVLLAIDNTEGESSLYLTPQAQGEASIDQALRGIEVYDAKGKRINVRAPKAGLETAASQKPMAVIPLAGHDPGMYTIKIKGAPAATGVALDARLPSSHVVMKMKPSSYELLLGNETTLEIVLNDGDKPIVGARVSSNLLFPDLSPGQAIAFSEVGNGVYRATVGKEFNKGMPIGAYLADIRAEGMLESGVPFMRHGRTGFHFGVPTAKIADIGTLKPVNDGDGKVKSFDIDVALDVKSFDRLELAGTLAALGADGKEHPVAYAWAGQGLGDGKKTLTLSFDAGYVKLTHLEGPYVLRNLKLFSLGTNTLFMRALAGGERTVSSPGTAMMHMPEMTGPVVGMLKAGLLKE